VDQKLHLLEQAVLQQALRLLPDPTEAKVATARLVAGDGDDGGEGTLLLLQDLSLLQDALAAPAQAMEVDPEGPPPSQY
jgi:hypothetical protein